MDGISVYLLYLFFSMASKYRKPLTDAELLDILENDNLDDFLLPLDNAVDTDCESYFENEAHLGKIKYNLIVLKVYRVNSFIFSRRADWGTQ